MGRPRKQSFATRALDGFTRQLLYSPPAKRAEQVRRAEALHDELDPDSAYPLEYLVYRVTRYRSEQSGDDLIPGDVAAADLRLLIDRLSKSSPCASDPDEPVWSLAELAAEAGTSVRTVDRWRNRGLRWRWWLRSPEAAPVAGIPRTAWLRFRESRPEVVRRAARFSRIKPEEHRRILARARTHAAEGLTPAGAARRLAAEFDRGVESMRRMMIEHDKEHPDAPLFSRGEGPLPEKERALALRAYRRGVPLPRVAQRLGRSVPAIHHLVQKLRFAELRAKELRYLEPPGFEDERALLAAVEAPFTPEAERASGADEAEIASLSRTPPRTDDLSLAVAAVVRQAAPPWPVQRRMIKAMHARRALADRLLRNASPHAPRARDLDRAERLIAEADRIERRIVALHLAAALSLVRRHLQAHALTGSGPLLRYLDLAMAVVEDAVVNFDPTAPRVLEAVIRNRLLRRFAREREDAGRAGHRPPRSAWARRLLQARGIACEWPRDATPPSESDR